MWRDTNFDGMTESRFHRNLFSYSCEISVIITITQVKSGGNSRFPKVLIAKNNVDMNSSMAASAQSEKF
jgi:hypothetical protein